LHASGNRPVSGGERSRLDEVIGDVASTLLNGIGVEPRDRVGDVGVQLLSAGARDAGK
jgi:hypothetical protein